MASTFFLTQITDERNKILYGSNIDLEEDFSVFETAVSVASTFLLQDSSLHNRPLGLFVEYDSKKLLADIAMDENLFFYLSVCEDIYPDSMLGELGEIYSAQTEQDIFVYAECDSEGNFTEAVTRKQLDENLGSYDFPLSSPLYKIEADFYSRGRNDIESVYDSEKEEPFDDVLAKVFDALSKEDEYGNTVDFYLEVHAAPVGPGSVDRRYLDDMLNLEYSASMDSDKGDMFLEKTSDETPPYIDYISRAFYHPAKGLYYEEPVAIY